MENAKTVLYSGSAILLLLLSACKNEVPFEQPLTPVRVEAVSLETPEEGPRYSGSLDAASRTDLAFRLGGYIAQVMTVADGRGGMRLIYDGDVIPKGAVLARLREADYQAKVDQAASQLEQSRAALKQTEEGVRSAEVTRDKAKQDFERATALFQTQSLTKSDMDAATAQLRGAEAMLDGTKAQLPLAQARIAGAQAFVEEAKLALRDTAMISPVDGVLVKRMVEVGSLVGPGVPTFVIADLNTLKAVFGAPDAMLSKLRPGVNLSFTADAAPGSEFRGRITAVATVADPRTRVFDVEVTFANPDQRLKPGMVVTLQLPAAQPQSRSLVVPMSSIVQTTGEGGSFNVFLLESQNGKPVVRSRAIALGGTLRNRIVVTRGLAEGDKIVVTGATLVHDGEAVQVIP